MYAGALFERNDFENPDLFARKMAVQFMFGAQLGWFGMSKYGRDRKLPNKDNLATYGIYNELMDAKYDQEIEYLRKLASAKKQVNHYFLHGRV